MRADQRAPSRRWGACGRRPVRSVQRFVRYHPGYDDVMLYTIFLVLAIIALLVFIFGRARV